MANSRAVPEGVEDLAQGEEETMLMVDLGPELNWTNVSGPVRLSVRWDAIMRAVLPQTFGGGAENESIASALAALVQETAFALQDSAGDHSGWRTAIVSRSDFGKVMNQMTALGLVVAVPAGSSTGTAWRATNYEIQVGSRLLAVKKGTSTGEYPF